MSAAGGVWIGPTAYAKLFGFSRETARKRMEEMLAADEASGNPIRVKRVGLKGALRTTMAAIHRDQPAARDAVLVKKVEDLEREMVGASRRLDKVMTDLRKLTEDVIDLQRKIARSRPT